MRPVFNSGLITEFLRARYIAINDIKINRGAGRSEGFNNFGFSTTFHPIRSNNLLSDFINPDGAGEY